MSRYEFIFSEKPARRLARHGLFWLVFAFHVFLFRYYVYDLKYLSYASTYLIRLQNLLLFLPVSVFYAYLSMYVLLPRYILPGRYWSLFLIVLLLAVVLVLLSYTLTNFFSIRLAFDMPLNRTSLVRQIDFTVNNGLVYPLTVSGFAIGIKMGKKFYLQQTQNEELARQKIKAEVLLIKNQIHPRFLFHSLNNIYSDMLRGSEQSPGLLLKLADLLSYLLYESDDLRVPLERELSLFQTYTDLEQISWGNRLILDKQENIPVARKLIAPLVLLSVAELVFENIEKEKRIIKALEIKVRLIENDFILDFVVTGTGMLITAEILKENAQFSQVSKRLQALYPGKHRLHVTAGKDSIQLFLSLTLEDTNTSTSLSKLLMK